jgi:hypothetical protein
MYLDICRAPTCFHITSNVKSSAGYFLDLFFVLKIEAKSSSETPVNFYQTIRLTFTVMVVSNLTGATYQKQSSFQFDATMLTTTAAQILRLVIQGSVGCVDECSQSTQSHELLE